MLDEKIRDAELIIEKAFEEYQPEAVFCLFSGGHDSLTAVHLAARCLGDRLTGVAHIDTGIGIPETQEFVRQVCVDQQWPLLVYRASENTRADGAPDPQIYDDIVVEHGFPGPAAHRQMYSKLKQRQVRRLVREHKRSRKGRILLISGVRLEESDRRMGNVKERYRDGAQVWLSPMLYFTQQDQHEYMGRFGLPKSPVKAKLCMSGECLCGAFAHEEELKEIEFWYPEVGERIRVLQEKAKEAGHIRPWGWGANKSFWLKKGPSEPSSAEEEDSDAGEMPLCTGCVARYQPDIEDLI